MIGYIQTATAFSIQLFWTYWLIEKNIYFIPLVPISFVFTAFFIFYTLNITYNILSPKYWTEINTKYLSFRPCKTIQQEEYSTQPQKITVQIPVYTEDFEKVIKKTLENVLEICRYYNNHPTNNTVEMNIFINDDGLNVIPETEKQKRIDYYNETLEIFYIGRAKENRKGRFKKASNMNFCLNQLKYCNKTILSLAELGGGEEEDEQQQPTKKWICNPRRSSVTTTDEWKSPPASPHKSSISSLSSSSPYAPFSVSSFSKRTSNMAVMSHNHKYLYKTNTHFQLGNYILLLDCDSKITKNKIFELMKEFQPGCQGGQPPVFIQMNTKTMYVGKSHWEKVIGHFTNSIYNNSFLYSCASGLPSPLVGHNCILHWDVIDKIYNSSPDDETRYVEYWDETKVSEDFVMSLNLQFNGYYGRYIYYDCGFEEGVTLNVMDEISKFSKYAYGINELIFHPVKDWGRNGVFTEIFTKFFMTNQIDAYVKYSVVSYIGCYYSLAFSQLFSLMNYYLWEWNSTYRTYTEDNLNSIIVLVGVFSVAGTISNIVVSVKHADETTTTTTALIQSVKKNVYYSVFLTWFFSGLSYHFMTVILGHFFSRNNSWKTTNKEEDVSSRYLYWMVERIAQYKWMYLWCMGLLVQIYLLYFTENEEWRIRSVSSIAPLILSVGFHMTMPILL